MRALLVSSVLLVTGCTTIRDYEEEPQDEPILTNTTVPTVPLPDCNAYAYRDQTYNCSQLDRCTEQDFQYRLACCECDPALCDADPSCPDPENPPPPPGGAESCMVCHNGSTSNDYSGDGIDNPHQVQGAMYVQCTTCHGGNGAGLGKTDSHVPVPPQIGDDENLQNNATAYFNFLTRTGLDKYPDYTVNGQTYSAMDYIQFMNPGDIRAVSEGRGCGNSGCHGSEHGDWMSKSPIYTEMGFWSNTMYTVGSENFADPGNDWYSNTLADIAFRAVEDPTFVYDPAVIGRAQRFVEAPEYAVYGDPTGFYQNPLYDANTIANFRYTAAEDPQKTNRVRPGSPLEQVVMESVTFQCGDCHLGSAGANNRYADFRSAGCTACHMRYSLDGRSRSADPNVNKLEPVNPDAIAAPERPHVYSHQIANVAKVLPNGAFIQGISDNACVGCHQGSNRTVLQFWGIRLDQNQDLVNAFQYPQNPNNFENTALDTRLFDPAVQNNTFNGRNADQYILYEDYDADNLDDTPPDVHYERGMGCIDCHGSRDVHNGTERTDGTIDPTSGRLSSRMGQMVMIECESCHGDDHGYALTASCEDYMGVTKECAIDLAGNPLRNVYKDAQGYWLTSRLTGDRHYIPQTLDTIVDSNKANPTRGNQLVYSPLASYAMGVANGADTSDGIGPQQANPNLVGNGFTHMENLACDSCHASWNVNCIGCHLQLAYNANPANYFFSNVTGERITVQVTNADFMYITPIWMGIEVNQRGQIGSAQPGMKAFYRYLDLNGNLAAGITFSDRNGNGNNPIAPRGAFPALSHNRIYAHSIRGRQTQQYEGTRQCVTCHVNEDQLANFADYPVFFDILENRDYAAYANNNYFALLQTEIGLNTSNQRNNPYFPHMVSGLGTGLLQVDAFGCPNNPLDNNANRQFCQNGAPANNFDPNNTVYDLDKTVELSGVSNTSHTQPMLDPIAGFPMRAGAIDPGLAGPIGTLMLYKLAGYDANQGALILDSYIDADGNAAGGAADFVQ